MKSGEDCGYCEIILDVHCTLHGATFCDLREAYYTDDQMTIDQVYDQLYAIATPQQLAEAMPLVEARVAQGVAPAPPVTPDWIAQWGSVSTPPRDLIR